MSAPFIVVVFLRQAIRTSNTPTEIRQCRPGFFHNVTIDLCQVCPSGTYTNSYNLESRCDRCSTCTGLRTLIADCTASSDAVCKCPDEYYEHEDGCSPKPGVYAEARLPNTPEWTWSQILLIILSFAVVVHIGFAIFVIVRCPEIRTKLLCCLRNNITERPHQPPNGCRAVTVGNAANVPNNTAQPQVNGGLATASASTIAHHPISLSSIATGGAADAGTYGGTAVASAQPEVHLESNTAGTPKNDHRMSRTGNVEDTHELVVAPPKASSGGLETPDGNKGPGNSQQCVMRSSHQDDCTRCSETNDSSTAETQKVFELSAAECDGSASAVVAHLLSSTRPTGTLGCAVECQKSSTVVTVDDSASREDSIERRPLLQQ